MPPKPNPPSKTGPTEKVDKPEDVEEAPSNWSTEQKRVIRKLEQAAKEVRETYELARYSRRDPSRIDAFRGRMSVLHRYYEKFESHVEELYDMNYELNPTGAGDEASGGAPTPYTEYPDSRQSAILLNIKAWYLECLEAKETLDREEAHAAVSRVPTGPNVTLSEFPAASSLPKLNLPRFSGQYEQWPQFRDAYRSMVHDSTSLTPIQKYHYLISVLTGDAKATIANYAITEGNYLAAYNSLVQTYESPRILASVYLGKLFKLALNKGSSPAKPTQESYRAFLTNVSDTVASFKMLTIPDQGDFVLFNLAIKCLDPPTREAFEISLRKDQFPTVKMLTEFVRTRQIALQLADPTGYASGSQSEPIRDAHYKGPKHDQRGGVTGRNTKTSLMTTSQVPPPNSKQAPQRRASVSCAICTQNHGLYQCAEFNRMTPFERLNRLKGWTGCKICLSNFHTEKACQSKNPECRFCARKHNGMLCVTKNVQKPATSPPPTPPAPTLLSSNGPVSDTEVSQVLLGTILVEIFDARGEVQTLRGVLDSGSQFSYLTHRAMLRLGLQLTRVPRKISTLGGALFEQAQGITRAELSGRGRIPNLQVEFVVVNKVVSSLPTFPVSNQIRKRFGSFQLADPQFHRVGPVDLLVGADLFCEIVNGSIHSIDRDLPHLLPTIYGEVVMGKIVETPSPAVHGASLFSMTTNQENVMFDLERFWESEEVPSATQPTASSSDNDELAEQLFREGSYRLPTGRFGVRLPFKTRDVPDMRSSRGIAKRRFLNLETKFRKNPTLKEAYCQFMTEYEQLGHMELAPEPADSQYVIPHHAVFNKAKIRVVFDASAGSPSLNSQLVPGNPLLNDLRTLLLEFRTFQIAFTSDVVKMYRNITMHPEHRNYQHILWRKDESEPIRTYQLSTVVYGVNSSPYQALRVLNELGTEVQSEFPLAARAISRNVYMDDFICGAHDVATALQLQSELIATMRRGEFELAKWASNSPEILAAAPQGGDVHTVEFSPTEFPESAKILGLRWEIREDGFRFTVEAPDSTYATKRIILSTVARIFDPIGLLSPVTIAFKILIQKLWIAKVTWDQQVPKDIQERWEGLIKALPAIGSIKIPRRVTVGGAHTYQLIGFCDASEAAMCGAIYLRAISDEHISVQLLTAKTKVAPLREKLTIPKLELSAAMLLSRLYESLTSFREAISEQFISPVFFTDSQVTLAWINKEPNHWKVFVANRVAVIQRLTPADSWRHIPGSMNPSDLGSRGVLPQGLVENQIWFSGPPFLSLPDESWPRSAVDVALEIPEGKSKVVPSAVSLLCYDNSSNLVAWMNRFSNYRTLLRVTARILRLIHNRRNKQNPRQGEFHLLEITQAFTSCVKATQEYHFLKGNPANFPKVQKEYSSLSLFLDERGVIRVGGRLENSPIDQFHRHPVFLPLKGKFTLLLVQYYHTANFHPGPSLLHALIQRRAWIPHARRLVRTITRKCVKCYSARASAIIPRMGDLPHCRVTAARAFSVCGVDFAGPFQHRASLLRKAVISKMYFCVFICMATKGVHLEAVTDLTTKAFLAALSRFTARRGKPTTVYSDNGGNFCGASRELRELYQWLARQDTQDGILAYTSEQEINWSFSPPFSPAFGGTWEAAVKSVKHFLRSAVGDTPLTFEEFSTLLAQTEAILNSRPLVPLSDSPDEFDYLSPGHFLVGGPLLAPPEKDLLSLKINHLDRWQLIKRAYQQIWNRFQIEYLSTLQKRTKWTADRPGLQIGDLVLIKTEGTQPLYWPRGRVIETHPGKDGRVRVVTIRTIHGQYKRSTANLAPLLPVNESSREPDDVIPAED